MQKRPEAPRLQLSLMQTQLSQSGSLPSAHFLYLALRKAERDHCPEGASMPEMLSALTQTYTCTPVYAYHAHTGDITEFFSKREHALDALHSSLQQIKWCLCV